jgi:hypothetical protein
MTIFGRIISTGLVGAIAATVNALVNAPATIMLGEITGKQFESTNSAYLATQAAFQSVSVARTLIAGLALLVVFLIWVGPVKRGIAGLLAMLLFGLVIAPQPASAYYADNDYAETFMVLPNESAFWLPDVGNNKDSQVRFGSEDYYAANKIAAKRFDVTTHVKLPNSGLFANKYVSPGRLIKVDRSPTTREWVKASHRGTGKGDESFPCQSKEGLDVNTGVAVGTYVTEEQAPKFLYHFGVNTPKGDPNDPNVAFTSVYYGKSLAQVMDEKIRNKVQAMVCDQMTKHTLDDANEHASDIMADIQKNVGAYLDSVGITLDFIGWADTFEFSDGVQASIDRRYIANKDKTIADDMAPRVATLQALATAESTRTFASKWNGALPTSVSLWWLPSSLTDWLGKASAK